MSARFRLLNNHVEMSTGIIVLRGQGSCQPDVAETFLDIDVCLTFVALENLLKYLSYRLFIAVHLSSIKPATRACVVASRAVRAVPVPKGWEYDLRH